MSFKKKRHNERRKHDPLYRSVSGSLVSSINDHGPITRQNVPLACKRIVSQWLAGVKERDDSLRRLLPEDYCKSRVADSQAAEDHHEAYRWQMICEKLYPDQPQHSGVRR